MEIDNKLRDLNNNFSKTIRKLENSVLFWNRFNLSLPGRICVANTFLLSLINHLGSFLMPEPTQIERMQSIIDNFCSGSLNIAKSRLYIPPKKGGLGLMPIKEFLIAQHTFWFKRCWFSTRDNWRVDLTSAGYGNPITTNPDEICRLANPVLHSLAKSFFNFKERFFEKEGNFKLAFILNNPIFRRNNSDFRILDSAFFKGSNLFKVAMLRFCDLFTDDKFKYFKDLRKLNDEYLLDFSLVIFFKLRAAMMFFLHSRKNSVDKNAISILSFFNTFKKGSKSCRKVLLSHQNNLETRDSNLVVSFFNICQLPVPDTNAIESCLNLWTVNSIPNYFHEFIFKFYNNRLGINTRTSHFGGLTRACTFCSLAGSGADD